MPVQPTYPGVYIEELPSGVRTITGVATSITAFIGRARRGPVNESVTINNYGDFERIFGELWIESTMSYAVRDFYMNGGKQAIIVRLFRPFYDSEEDKNKAKLAAEAVKQAAVDASGGGATADDVAVAAKTKADKYNEEPEKSAAKFVADAARHAANLPGADANSVVTAINKALDEATPLTKAKLSVNTLNLEAAYEGDWGNDLRARIDHNVVGDDAANLFNLSVKDVGTGVIEQFRNVSVVMDHKRRIDKVLEQESRLVRVLGVLPPTKPGPSHPVDKNGIVPPGDDPFSTTYSSGVEDPNKATDGWKLTPDEYSGNQANKQGLYALEDADLFNLLCIPPVALGTDLDMSIWAIAAKFCEKRRAMLIIDPPSNWKTKDNAKTNLDAEVGVTHKNAALFFPRLKQPNPKRDYQMEEFAPCGAVAGIFSRTDAQRGVWKAPAGLEATLNGVPALSVSLTDDENGELNPLGINCLRAKPPAGRIIWGSRTREGDDRLASEWKYIPVRRMALFLEESLFRGTQWVVFEPNDEPLWAQIRLNIGAFMHNLFRQGAFQGQTPKEAYFVKCDSETTTQNDINLGIVNILVGFAPLKPAEFVIIKIQQMAGQIEA